MKRRTSCGKARGEVSTRLRGGGASRRAKAYLLGHELAEETVRLVPLAAADEVAELGHRRSAKRRQRQREKGDDDCVRG